MNGTIPRVSNVLGILFPNSLAFVPEDALARGTRLHEYLEFWVNSIMVGMTGPPMDHLDLEEQQRATAMVNWLTTEKIVFQATESLHHHKWDFVGHPDMLGNWHNRAYCFDYKFADTLTEQNEVQAEAYRHLTGRPVALVQCKRDTTIIVKKCKPRPDLWAAFLAALHVHKFQNARHQKGNSYVQ